ncbi:hypothetical protein AAC387_Pa07g2395 [Persea americana]
MLKRHVKGWSWDYRSLRSEEGYGSSKTRNFHFDIATATRTRWYRKAGQENPNREISPVQMSCSKLIQRNVLLAKKRKMFA